MLQKLSVQNYALIDSLDLQFGKGLNIITGETGAGKSVLMGALGLLLGDRADSSSLLDKTKKCFIRGEFTSSPAILEFLKKSDIDSDSELTLHREINKEGKSRSFINDTPVNLSTLRELGDLLVDIHSQHETLLLNKTDFQLSVIDAFAKHPQLLTDFASRFQSYRTLKNELKAMEEEDKRSRSELDYLQFQFNELDEAALIPGEQVLLEEELKVLSHSEEIKISTNKISAIIEGAEKSLLSGLNESVNLLSGITKYSSEFNESQTRLKAVQIELKDIISEIEHASDKISVDPNRLEIINDRLNFIYRLEQKHRIDNVEGLITLRDSISEKLLNFSSLETKMIQSKKELESLFLDLKKTSVQISENRKNTLSGIETKIKKLLADLAMPDAVLKIEVTDKGDEDMNETGRDKVKFLFSANKGIAYSDISKVASGGELSRLMLSLKASVAKLIDLPTIVFDEIDTGVSGETAFKIGKVMQELSLSHQLLAITHLPQIASRGEDHFYVFKEVTGKKTYTKVRKLTYDERIVEVARMLSGDKPTAIALENAKELLKV